MRALFSVVAALILLISAPVSAFAGDAVNGAKVFSANCAACHAGGGNVVNGEHTLQQDDLKAYLAQYNNGHESAIVAQVTYGLNEMPAFIGTLTENQISGCGRLRRRAGQQRLELISTLVFAVWPVGSGRFLLSIEG